MSNKKNNSFQSEMKDLIDERRQLRNIYQSGSKDFNELICDSYVNIPLSKWQAAKKKNKKKNDKETAQPPVKPRNNGNVSQRSLYNASDRLDNLINSGNNAGDTFLTGHSANTQKNLGKAARLLHDPYKIDYNYFVNVFRQHTITPNDIIFYLYLTEVLSFTNTSVNPYPVHGEDDDKEIEKITRPYKSENGFTLDEIHPKIDALYNLNSDIYSRLTESEPVDSPLERDTLRNRLNELADYGFLVRSGIGNRVCYRLTDPLLSSPEIISNDDLGRETYEELVRFISFYSNHGIFSIPGFLLGDRFCRYAYARLFRSERNKNLYNIFERINFMQKNRRFINILDDDIVWSALQSIINRKPVTYTYHKKKNKDAVRKTVFPIKIVSELTYGRHYLFCWEYTSPTNSLKGSFRMLRMDRLDILPEKYHLHVPDENIFTFMDNYDSDISKQDFDRMLDCCYRNNMQNSWNIDFGQSKAEKILLHFTFTDDNVQNMTEYIRRTGRGGELTPTGNLTYDYRITVRNSNEIVTWVNSFGRYVAVDPTESPILYNTIQTRTMEALANYESI